MNSQKDSWNGEHYKKHKGFQNHSWALNSIEKINLNRNKTILDIGCGDGKLTAEIAKKVPSSRVLGIDFSQSMIDSAKKEYNHISNLSFKKANAIDFSLKTKFDLITSFFVLHWISDQSSVLDNIKKHLKHNGKTIIIMLAAEKEAPICAAIETLEQEGKWKTAIKNCKKAIHPKSAKQIEDLLNQTGFGKKNIKTIPRKSESTSIEATVQSLMRSIPHSSKLPYNKAFDFCLDLATKMYSHFNKKSHEPIHFQTSFLQIEAQL